MLFTDFSSGELSKTLYGRTDLAQYYHGASYLKNFSVIPTGGIKKRAGFKFLGSLSGECRIIPFYLNNSISYIIEMGSGYMRFWKTNGTLCMKDASNVLEFRNGSGGISWLPTSLATIREIQFAQLYDKLIMVHRSLKPFQLVWNSGSLASTTDSFSIGQLDFTTAGLSSFVPDINLTDAHDVWDSGTNKLKDGYTNYNGTKFSETDLDTDTFQTAGNYPGCVAFFEGRLWFASTDNNPQKVWASCAPGLVTKLDGSGNSYQEYEDRYFKFASYEYYITVSQVYKDEDVHLFTASCGTVADTGVESDTTDDVAEVLGYCLFGASQDLSSAIKSGNVATDYYITGDNIEVGTKVVAIRTVTSEDKVAGSTYYDELKNLDVGTRIVVMDKKCVTAFRKCEMSIQLWKSLDTATADDIAYSVVINKYTSAADSVYFTPASDKNDSIKWIAAKNALFIGTESSEFVVPSGVDATSIQCRLNSRHGSGSLQATAVGETIVFVTNGNKNVKALTEEQNGSKSQSLTVLCPEMLSESAAVDFDYTNEPNTRLVLTRTDGNVSAMLYEQALGIAAWSRISHGKGKIVSCCTGPDEDGADILFAEIYNSTAGTYNLEALNVDDDVHMDSYREYSASIASSYTSSAVVCNYTTGKFAGLASVQNLTINEGDNVIIGYPFVAELKSMPVVNSSQSAQKRIVSLVFRFLESYMPTVWNDTVSRYETLTAEEEPYSGIKKIAFPGTWDKDVFFRIETSSPLSCTVLSVDASLT